MPLAQQIMAVVVSVGLLAFIIDLVRRRKLREEYSWLWVMVGVGIFVLAIWYDLLVGITHLIGVGLPTSTLFFFGLVFLIVNSIHYSVKISQLSNQVKTMAQRLAIMGNELEELAEDKEEEPPK